MKQKSQRNENEGPTFGDLVESYKGSPMYLALSEDSKQQYQLPLARLLEMGSGLKMENAMQIRVALDRSRIHTDFWYDAIVHSDVTPYQKGRLITICKIVYRSHNMGNLVDSLKLPTKQRHTRGEAHPLTQEKVQAVLGIENRVDLRTYAVFVAFAFYTGMRPSEIRNLKWADVGPEFITVMGSKHRQEGVASRMIPILPEIQELLAFCRSLGSAWVFVSHKGKPLNKDIVCAKTQEIYALVGIKNATLYDARRGIATELFRREQPLQKIAYLLGHQSTRTTEKYVRLSMEEKARCYKGL